MIEHPFVAMLRSKNNDIAMISVIPTASDNHGLYGTVYLM